MQQRKYNGKEWIEAHGYDNYDYQARQYYPAIMRFTSIDPMAEKYYSISPYAYCANNPVNRIDPNGKNPIVIRGVVFTAAELALISTGVITCGFILQKNSNGSIGASQDIRNLMSKIRSKKKNS